MDAACLLSIPYSLGIPACFWASLLFTFDFQELQITWQLAIDSGIDIVFNCLFGILIKHSLQWTLLCEIVFHIGVVWLRSLWEIWDLLDGNWSRERALGTKSAYWPTWHQASIYFSEYKSVLGIITTLGGQGSHLVYVYWALVLLLWWRMGLINKKYTNWLHFLYLLIQYFNISPDCIWLKHVSSYWFITNC